MSGRDVDELAARDAETTLLAALQESDTVVEAMADGHALDGGRGMHAGGRRRMVVAALVLGAIGLLAARRRS